MDRKDREYMVGGLRVRSSFEVPGWLLLPGSEREPDVLIQRGALDAPDFGGGEQAARAFADGDRLVVAVRGVARYAIRGGSEILVDVEPGARPEDVLLYLTGAAIGAVLHQRGVFPLHGSAVLVGGEAVALTGPSRAGKSTLAAALARQGYALLTDDVAPLVRVGGGIGLWAGAARLKLDRGSLGAVSATADGLADAGGTRGKFQLPVERHGIDEAAPVMLRRIYVLRDGEGEPRTERLGPLEAVGALGRDVYFPGFVQLLGLEKQWFRLVAEVVNLVEVRRLVRPRGFEHMARVIEILEADWRQGATAEGHGGDGRVS